MPDASMPPGYTTEQWMRSLAGAVERGNGVRFQPIFPETLRAWADEIEQLKAKRRHEG